jgi:hypothetical protein
MFNNYCTISLNIRKPSHNTPTHQGLYNGTKSIMGGGSIINWEISQLDKQTNKQPSLRDKRKRAWIWHA